MVRGHPITFRLTLYLCGLLGVLVLGPAGRTAGVRTQTPRSRRTLHRKPARPAPIERECGPGGILKLSSPESSQGSLLLIELHTPAFLAQVRGTWDAKEILFWQEAQVDGSPGGDWRALLGVDLELKAGEYPLTVTGKAADSSQEINCGSPLAVSEGKFATESLHVAPNFVQPNAEQLARAEAERERLRAIFATITPERLWAGSFRVPLDGVTTGGNFGKRRVLNGTPGSPHGGVDFPAPAGTPIYAAQRGRVVLAEPLYFSGNTVVIDHGLGLYTFYGHMESIDAKVGDLIETGALLGKVGATGRVTGPHLHWGLTLNRSRVNPLQLVSLLGGASSGAAPADGTPR